MKRIIRLTERDLSRIVRRVINERQYLMEAPATYEGSMDSLYQGVVNALNKALETYRAAKPDDNKFKNKVFAWNKKGLGKPADPNMQGITDAKYYIIYGPKGSTSEETESVTYVSTLLVSNGPQVIGRILTRYLNTIPYQIQVAPAKGVVNNWVKTYTAPKPVSKD